MEHPRTLATNSWSLDMDPTVHQGVVMEAEYLLAVLTPGLQGEWFEKYVEADYLPRKDEVLMLGSGHRERVTEVLHPINGVPFPIVTATSLFGTHIDGREWEDVLVNDFGFEKARQQTLDCVRF